MKTMQDYELRCTEGQTCRAYVLGAPIKARIGAYELEALLPTTQQMIGWMREQGFLFKIEEEPNGINIVEIRKKLSNSSYEVISIVKTDRSAELAAIDAVLDYLEKGGTK